MLFRSTTINDTILNIKKDFSTKNYAITNIRNSYDNVEHNIYKKYDNRVFNNTTNNFKRTNNYSNDITSNYKINRINNVKKTYYDITDDITINKTSKSYSNDTCNLFKNANLFSIIDHNYNIKHNTSSVIHNIRKHTNNKYEKYH